MANKKFVKTYKPGTYTGLGIALGTSFGLILGMLVFNNLVMGVGVGFTLGLIYGTTEDQRKQNSE